MEIELIKIREAMFGDRNPFTDEYWRDEIRWFGRPKNYERDGLEVKFVTPPFGACPDYLNKNFRIEFPELPVMLLDGELWMSLTSMEVQSQFPAIWNCSGFVGCAGIGLGYAVMKMAQRDAVDDVWAFEQDERVIRFFKHRFRKRKGFDKIKIIHGDAREEIPRAIEIDGCKFDFLYSDIYKCLLCDEVVSDIELFRPCVEEIEGYQFWGMERVLLDALNQHVVPADFLTLGERLFLSYWLEVPISTNDPRLQNMTLANLYEPLVAPDWARQVLHALGRWR